jgi:surface polysaccharide O-acyltransferase-like enzyme
MLSVKGGKEAMKSRYTGIDICRLAFACLIPLLHISLPDSLPLYIVRQYVSRLGVPFFFAVSGMFLSKAIADRGNLAAMKKQLWRIGVLLCIWFCIYAPLFSRGRYSINEYLFLTPGYLWYLSAMLFAVIPFCLIKNKSAKHGIAMILYIVGTLFGGSYQWLSGGV